MLSARGATIFVPPVKMGPLDIWPSDTSDFDAIVLVPRPIVERDRAFIRAQRNAQVPCATLAVLYSPDPATARASIECGAEICFADAVIPTGVLAAVELTVTRTRQWRRGCGALSGGDPVVRPSVPPTSRSEFSLSGVVETLCEIADISKREREVLGEVLQGRANRDIAAGLGISQRTVKFHVHNLMKKLKARSRNDIFRVYFAEAHDQTFVTRASADPNAFRLTAPNLGAAHGPAGTVI